MSPLFKQFDAATYDEHRRDRMPMDDGTWPDSDEEDGDDYIEHMKFECRMGRFV